MRGAHFQEAEKTRCTSRSFFPVVCKILTVRFLLIWKLNFKWLLSLLLTAPCTAVSSVCEEKEPDGEENAIS